jgi:hypothetical protein
MSLIDRIRDAQARAAEAVVCADLDRMMGVTPPKSPLQIARAALELLAAYPATREAELSAPSMREIARAALADMGSPA